jgi:hypothetical protein
VIVGVPHLTGAVVGEIVPDDLIEFATWTRDSAKKISGKRKIEDIIVSAMADRPASFGVSQELADFED